MANLSQLQIINTLLIRELNKNAVHDNDIIKFQSTISPFSQHIIKCLFQNTSISIKFSNLLLDVLNQNARINLLLAQTSD